MKVISREDAKRLNFTRYYTAVNCIHNHDCERNVKSGQCVECARVYSRKYRKNNPEVNREASKRCNQSEGQKARRRKHYQKHKERLLLESKQYSKDNPHIGAAACRKYQATKLNATPKWLSKTQLKEIQKFYEIARWYSEPMHVDHIVPLQGKNVCGLHVPWNLQIIPARENLEKHNKLEV